jgi:hypothetical protein
MARTSQTARKSTGGRIPTRDSRAANGHADSEDGIDEATKAKYEEIEKGEMRPELKYLDRKQTESGQTYYKETVEEEVPEQVSQCLPCQRQGIADSCYLGQLVVPIRTVGPPWDVYG